MKTYLFDIGHPAHVHYFKDAIKSLKKNNKVIVVARNKDMTFDLLQKFDIDFISRGKGFNGLVSKFFYLIYAVAKILIISRSDKVDRIVGFGSPYAAISSRFKRADNVIFTDTEHAYLSFKLYKPFTDHIIINKYYNRTIECNKLRITRLSGFFEEIYLSEIKQNKIRHHQKKVLFRIIDWNAHHDVGYSGLKDHHLVDIVTQISHFERF
jgi:predicted glycosyltransferase